MFFSVYVITNILSRLVTDRDPRRVGVQPQKFVIPTLRHKSALNRLLWLHSSTPYTSLLAVFTGVDIFSKNNFSPQKLHNTYACAERQLFYMVIKGNSMNFWVKSIRKNDKNCLLMSNFSFFPLIFHQKSGNSKNIHTWGFQNLRLLSWIHEGSIQLPWRSSPSAINCILKSYPPFGQTSPWPVSRKEEGGWGSVV